MKLSLTSYSDRHPFIIILFFFLLISEGIALSQTQKTLSGSIYDKSLQPLPGVIILLSDTSDSTIISSTATSPDGLFSFDVISGKYLLNINMIGFKKETLTVDASVKNNIVIDSIILEENLQALKEVTVVGSKSHIKFLAGRTIINPELSIILSQSNSLEVLRSIPGIIINEDGTIILNGQQGVKVQINRKDTYLSGNELLNLLKSTHASSIDEVEVVTSPSAEYDASGKAGIVNIKLKKTSVNGSTFAANINNQQGKDRRGDIWSRGTLRRNKVGMWIDYFHSKGDKAKIGKIYREQQIPGNLKSRQAAAIQNISLVNKDKSDNIKIGIDYDLTSAISFELCGGLNLFNRKNPGSSSTSFINDFVPSDSILNTITNTKYRQSTPFSRFGFTYKDENKQELYFGADYLSFKHSENTSIQSTVSNTNNLHLRDNNLLGYLNNKIRIFSIQSDYSNPITDAIQIQAGAKAAWIGTDNKAIYKRQLDTQEIIDMAYSSKYSYKENSNAAYLQLNYKLNKWSFQAGLRLENVHISGNTYNLSTTKPDSAYKTKYTNLFPNFSLLYAIDNDNDFSINYNRRITRPNYKDLSPLGYIVDEYMIIKGNSELKAELTHNIELSYILKKIYRASLFGNITNKAIAQGFRELPNSGILIIPENMASNKRLGLRLDASRIIDLSWCQTGGSITLYETTNKWKEGDLKKKNKQVTPLFTTNSNFLIKKGWSSQLTGYYNGKMSFAQMKIPSGWSVSMGIRKKLLDDRLHIHFYVNDAFASMKEKAFFESRSIRGYSNIRYDETSVGISVYFNIRQEKQKRNNDRTSEESKRINY